MLRVRNCGSAWTAGLLAAAMAALPVGAQAVSLDAVHSQRDADGSARVELVLANPSARSIASIEFVTTAGEIDGCDAQVATVLESGGSQSCEWRIPAAFDQAALSAVVGYLDGSAETLRVTSSQARGGTIPQGIVILTASGVHNDADLDGALDEGEVIDYAYRLINTGTLALDTLAVTDLDGTVTCPATTLGAGAALTCNRSHAVTAGESAAGRVDNVVEVTGFDALGLPVQSSDLVIRLSFGGFAGISVVKSPFLADDLDGSGFANLGDIVRYDFVVTNTNAETLTTVELVEPDPSLIDTPIVCSGTTLDGNPFSGNGTGTLDAGDTVICTATYEIRQSDVDFGQALNLVEATGRSPLNLVVRGTGASALVLSGPGALEVSKIVAPSQAVPGQSVVYTVTVSNVGPVTLFDVQILDPLPIGIDSFDWTCTGLFCPNASGTGAINETIPAFPAGEVVVYTISAVVSLDAPNQLINVVTVLPPGIVECRPDGGPTPCEDDAQVEVRGQPIDVPAIGPFGLVLLMLTLGMVGASRIRG